VKGVQRVHSEGIQRVIFRDEYSWGSAQNGLIQMGIF
jgi:hypothetical protein